MKASAGSRLIDSTKILPYLIPTTGKCRTMASLVLADRHPAKIAEPCIIDLMLTSVMTEENL